MEILKNVVTNLSFSKNESKSQQHNGGKQKGSSCYKSQFFKE